jgi:hypothetical protein
MFKFTEYSNLKYQSMKKISLLLVMLAISSLSISQPAAGSGSQPGGANDGARCAPIGGGDGILIALALSYVFGRCYKIRNQKISEE